MYGFSKVADVFNVDARISRPHSDLCSLVSSGLHSISSDDDSDQTHLIIILIMALLLNCLHALICWYAAVLAYRLVLHYAPINHLKSKTLLVIFGSGGHTTEMLLMLKTLNPKNYNNVHFVLGHSDTWSLTKINDYLQT